MSEVRVRVSLISGIETGLAKIKSQFAAFRTQINSSFAGFFALGSIAIGLKAIVERATEMVNVAKRFAAPVEDLQRVANAAKEQGATITNVATAWNFLEKNRQKARDGSDEMRKHFMALGLSMKDILNLPIDQLFYRVADATAKSDDRGRSYAATVALMGRGAGVLYSTLEKGSAAIKAQGDAVGVMSAKTAYQLHAIGVEWERAKNFIFKWGGEIITSLVVIPKVVAAAFSAVINIITSEFNVIGHALSLALHGHFMEAGKSLASGSVQTAKEFAQDIKDIKVDYGFKPFEEVKGKGPIDEEPEASKEDQSKADRVLTLRAQLAELERKSANDQLSTHEKINALIGQRAALLKEAGGEKDEEKMLSLLIDAQRISDEITKAQNEKGGKISVVADSLARIGGGGRTTGVTSDAHLAEAKTHTKLLTKISENTARKSGGGSGLTMKE